MYYVENSNPAIVSRETYEAVQALIKSRQPSCKRKAKNYPLTRTLLCPDCGHTFRRQVVNGTAYWLCAAKATNKTDCAWRRVKEDEVYAAFNLMIQNIRAIDKNQYDYLSGYKHWEITGFTEKSFECSWLKYLAPKHINKTSIKEVYEAFGS